MVEFPYSSDLRLAHFQTFEFLNKGPFVTIADLRGSQNMREEEFMALQQACPNLLYLNIEGWNLQTLAHFINVERNVIKNITKQEISLESPFKQLERLIANHCSQLTTLNIFLPSLKSLEIYYNHKLTTFNLKAPKIYFLAVAGSKNIEVINFEADDYSKIKYIGVELLATE